MNKDVKKLKEDFIAQGGKAEDFDAGRNAALKKADEIRNDLLSNNVKLIDTPNGKIFERC